MTIYVLCTNPDGGTFTAFLDRRDGSPIVKATGVSAAEAVGHVIMYDVIPNLTVCNVDPY